MEGRGYRLPARYSAVPSPAGSQNDPGACTPAALPDAMSAPIASYQPPANNPPQADNYPLADNDLLAYDHPDILAQPVVASNAGRSFPDARNLPTILPHQTCLSIVKTAQGASVRVLFPNLPRESSLELDVYSSRGSAYRQRTVRSSRSR